MSEQRAVAEGLWAETPAGPRLVGGVCSECGTTTFPRQHACARCTSVGIEERLLPSSGTLWSHTVQAFPPKAPYLGEHGFRPYGVGYVELGDVLVETRLTTTNGLSIGMEVQLVLEPFATDEDGTEVLTFAFAPVGESS